MKLKEQRGSRLTLTSVNIKYLSFKSLHYLDGRWNTLDCEYCAQKQDVIFTALTTAATLTRVRNGTNFHTSHHSTDSNPDVSQDSADVIKNAKLFCSADDGWLWPESRMESILARVVRSPNRAEMYVKMELTSSKIRSCFAALTRADCDTSRVTSQLLPKSSNRETEPRYMSEWNQHHQTPNITPQRWRAITLPMVTCTLARNKREIAIAAGVS